MHKYKLQFICISMQVCVHTLKLLGMLYIYHKVRMKRPSHNDIETVLNIFRDYIFQHFFCSAFCPDKMNSSSTP